MSAACAASSASAASRSQRSAVSRGTGSPPSFAARRRSATVPPLKYSMTMYVFSPCSPVSKIVAMCGCSDTRAAVRASRWKRARAPGSAAKWEPSTLTATTRPSRRSSTSQTVAIPPLAMWRVTR